MPTLRLLMDWPINGLKMKGWIVEKNARDAASLIAAGCAEVVQYGTPPPPDQMEWAIAMRRASERLES